MHTTWSRGGCLFFLLLFSFLPNADAGVMVGASSSSATSGRLVPGIHAGILTKSFGFTLNSTGVKSPVSLYSNYQLNFFSIWDPGRFLWGPVSAGIGGGISTSILAYRPTPGDAPVRKYDFAAGPAFRVQWQFLGPVFLAVESLFGIRNLGVVLLSFQDLTTVSAGLQL